jgi:hypothetical protein
MTKLHFPPVVEKERLKQLNQLDQLCQGKTLLDIILCWLII